MTSTAVPSFKNKTVATALAAIGGTFGLHRFYLVGAGRWLPWIYVVFSWTLVPTFAGFIEALRFATTPDEKWDACWNGATPRRNHSGAIVVLLAIATLLGGLILLLTLISFALGRYFGAGETFF